MIDYLKSRLDSQGYLKDDRDFRFFGGLLCCGAARELGDLIKGAESDLEKVRLLRGVLGKYGLGEEFRDNMPVLDHPFDYPQNIIYAALTQKPRAEFSEAVSKMTFLNADLEAVCVGNLRNPEKLRNLRDFFLGLSNAVVEESQRRRLEFAA